MVFWSNLFNIFFEKNYYEPKSVKLCAMDKILEKIQTQPLLQRSMQALGHSDKLIC